MLYENSKKKLTVIETIQLQFTKQLMQLFIIVCDFNGIMKSKNL